MNNNTKMTQRRVQVFRHYSRKGYAAFRSIGREVSIGVLGVSMLCTYQVAAQATRPVSQPAHSVCDEDTLAQVTVAGVMPPLAEMQQARIVSVVTRDEIERAAAHTVNDLLKTVAGIDVRQRGGFSIQTDIGIDGGTFDQATILLNGINITNPQTGHHSLDLPVNPHDIERIEILEGAASRVYGTSAFGGAINIITRGAGSAAARTRCTATAAIQAGSWGTVGGDASLGLQTRRTAHTLTGGAVRSDGGTPNSDFHRTNAYACGQYTMHKVSLDWQAGLAQKQYGANTFYSAKYPNQWEGNRRYFASVAADADVGLHLRPSLYWNRSHDHFQLKRGTSFGENRHRTDVFGASLMADRRWVLGKTVVGASVRHERIASTNLGRPVGGTRHAATRLQDGGAGEPDGSTALNLSSTALWLYSTGLNISSTRLNPAAEGYTNADSRTQCDINLEHNVLLERWTFSAGVAVSMNTGIDRRWRLYPGVDIAYRPNRHWRVCASYNKGFRMPTFTDLYYTGAERQGNGSLPPEETHSLSVGSTYRARVFSATARVFYHRGRHMIDWVKHAATDPVYYAADFDLDNVGAQLQADFDFNTMSVPLKVGIGYTYIHQRRHDTQPVYKSSYAGEYLRNKLAVQVDHAIYRALSMHWALRVCDRVGAYELYAGNEPTGVLHPYSPYAVLDARLQYVARTKAGSLVFSVTCENVANSRYYDLGNIPQPGTCVLTGVRWSM